MSLSLLTVLPVAPWPLLLLLAAFGVLLVWWPASRAEARQPLAAQVRRSAMVALLLLAALRPGVPGGGVTVTATDLDVYFVVDTTSSIMARDYAGARPRLEGVKADVRAVADGLAGARYALLTFDHETVTRLPLTSDAQALGTAVAVLQPETSTYSQGSSISVAGPELAAELRRDQQAHPDRARVVFYLGDGEQTASSAPDPFDIDPTLVNGGAVLGYGTAAGGRMKETGTGRDGDITDPSTGAPAVSHTDEQALQKIATQLSLPYLHRTAPDGAGPVLDTVRLKETAALTPADQDGASGGRRELYWVLLLLVAALAAWELAASLASVTPARRPPARPTVPAPPSGGPR